MGVFVSSRSAPVYNTRKRASETRRTSLEGGRGGLGLLGTGVRGTDFTSSDALLVRPAVPCGHVGLRPATRTGRGALQAGRSPASLPEPWRGFPRRHSRDSLVWENRPSPATSWKGTLPCVACVYEAPGNAWAGRWDNWVLTQPLPLAGLATGGKCLALLPSASPCGKRLSQGCLAPTPRTSLVWWRPDGPGDGAELVASPHCEPCTCGLPGSWQWG